MDDSQLAYLEYLAIARMIAIREAILELKANSDDEVLGDIMRHANDLHNVMTETLMSVGLREDVGEAKDDAHGEIGRCIRWIRGLIPGCGYEAGTAEH
jgi:predicted small metal-binding protein